MNSNNSTCDFYGTKVTSRLLLGTARYPSPSILTKCISTSGAQIVTVSLRREILPAAASGPVNSNRFWTLLRELNTHFLPNTAGCYSAEEAIVTARMARDLFGTNWIKLEVIADALSLAPEPVGLVQAARTLCAEGFSVFPYTTSCVELGKALVDAGCSVLMPWASPIGTGQGLRDLKALEHYRNIFNSQTLVVDAGIGRPSHAAAAMEIGYDAVLVNTAIATACDPVGMAAAFAAGVNAGRLGYEAGLMATRSIAVPSTPMEGLAFHGNL